MNASTTPWPRGLAKLSHAVRLLCACGALALVLVPWFLWRDPDWVRQAATGSLGLDGRRLMLDGPTLLWSAMAGLPSTLLSLYGLRQLWLLFGHFVHGQVFVAAALGRLRRFSWVVLLGGLLAPIERAATSVALTLNQPPGQRQLVMSLGWSDYQIILMGAVLLAIATVFDRAAQIASENESFV